MPSTHILNVRKREPVSDDAEDTHSLLGGSPNNDNVVDVESDDHVAPRLRPSRRQSPLHTYSPVRTPRTTNRVRFDLAENERAPNHPTEAGVWAERGDEEERGDDYFSRHQASSASPGQRAPLLTDIEAPSVTVANTSLRLNIEELLEDADRPKSGMISAFMNMANSIM
jgi:solute carrier family 38 (sodium-coupled neutral amino acid transporter), member 11